MYCRSIFMSFLNAGAFPDKPERGWYLLAYLERIFKTVVILWK